MGRTIVAAFLLVAPMCTALQQFTPDQADWSTLNAKPLGGQNTAHDPDGVWWISSADWQESEWDGTIYNPSAMSRSEFVSAICPSPDRIRGIREVFYQHNPFADINNPTKAEVDEWHRIALNHVRALIGYTSEDRKVQKDICMFARALWGQERKFTTVWDTWYEGNVDSAYGPCTGGTNSHCGATFIPNATHQAPYLPEDHPVCQTVQGSEGIFSNPKATIPWSLKWSRALCATLAFEGFWGGHVGPFFHREKFGFSFWDSNKDLSADSIAVLRAKWTGRLMENLYCNPASDPECDPNNTGPSIAPCTLPLSWPQVDAAEAAGTQVFTGGLGAEMDETFFAWLCIEPTDYCTEPGATNDLACFKFDETDRVFAWYGWNSDLGIVTDDEYP